MGQSESPTSTDVVSRVFTPVGAEPSGDSINVDAVGDENAFRAHFCTQ